MAHEAQLEWERRAGRAAGVAAFAAAALSIASVALQAAALRDQPDNDRGRLLALDDHGSELIASAVTQALSLLLLGAVLWFLFRATGYRREETPSFVLYLLVAGPLVMGVAAIVNQIVAIDIADDFTSSGVQEGARGERRADRLIDDQSPVAPSLGLAGALALAFALVLVSMNAMRAGLLSRFMGYVGIIVGALYVIPLFGGPVVVQAFWLTAVGLIFLGRWPGGRGPAWESGEAIPWPGAADRARAQAEAEEAGTPDEVAGTEAPRRTRKRRR